MYLCLLTLFLICSCGFGPGDPPVGEPRPENDAPPPGGDGGDLSFVGDIKPILTDNCALSGCHAGAPMLETAKNFINSNSPKRIINGSMPPSYSPKYGQWTPEDKRVILEWYGDNM